MTSTRWLKAPPPPKLARRLRATDPSQEIFKFQIWSGTPQWIAERNRRLAAGKSVSFMDQQGRSRHRQGEAMNATRRKLTKAREQVGDLMLQTLIVEAHCKKLYGGEHWPHEQFLFVWELVRDWAEDRYGAAALTWWTICKIAEFTSKDLTTSRTATCEWLLATRLPACWTRRPRRRSGLEARTWSAPTFGHGAKNQRVGLESQDCPSIVFYRNSWHGGLAHHKRCWGVHHCRHRAPGLAARRWRR